MEGYTLGVLSDFKLDKNPKSAIDHLKDSLRKAAGCSSVKAACNLQIGDLYRAMGSNNLAGTNYSKVLAPGNEAPGKYLQLAKQRLGLLPAQN